MARGKKAEVPARVLEKRARGLAYELRYLSQQSKKDRWLMVDWLDRHAGGEVAVLWLMEGRATFPHELEDEP
jgi:hypothetical protein